MRLSWAFSFLAVIAFFACISVQPISAADSYEELQKLLEAALEKLDEWQEQIDQDAENSNEIVANIVRQGYDQFFQSTTLTKATNLARLFFNRYAQAMMQRFRVPPSDLAYIKEKVFDRLYDQTEPGKWVVHKMLYNPYDDREKTKYLSIYGYVRDTGNFDIIILDVGAKVEVAKDMLIIQNIETGDLTVEPQEIEEERLPEDSDLDTQDVQVLLNFFQAIAVRALKRDLAA